MALPLNMTAWIRRQLTRCYEEAEEGGENESYRVACFTLMHVYQSTQETEIQTIKLGSKQWDGKELAERFDTLATTHAAGLSGSQQFQLYAHFTDASVTSTKYPFRKAGESQDIGIGTEGPTQTGLMAQLMRLNESVIRIGVLQSDALLKQQGKMVEDLIEMNKNLRDENVQAFNALKEMIIDRTKAEHEDKKELLLIQRRTEERQKLLALAPGLINKVVGRNILPESGLAELALTHLKSTLTPEQIEQIGMALTPEQLSVLMPLLQQAAPPQPVAGDDNANP